MHFTASATALAIRNVLIATDFSPCSQRALLHAIAAAHHFGSTLHLVHVVPPTMFSYAPPEGYIGCGDAANAAVELARLDAERLLREALHRTHCEDLKCEVCVEFGSVGDVLIEFTKRDRIDLAVVGTHGKSGLRKIVLGSVAEEIFRSASCPVLTVGPHSWRSDPQSVHLRHVLFPTDLSPDSARALPFALASAAEFNAALTMLTAVKAHSAETPQDRARLTDAMRTQMREMVSARVLPQTDFLVQFGDVGECVIEAAAHLKTDLIVFGLKPPKTYSDHLPWMHAYKVVCEVSCPVLTLRGGWNRDQKEDPPKRV